MKKFFAIGLLAFSGALFLTSNNYAAAQNEQNCVPAQNCEQVQPCNTPVCDTVPCCAPDSVACAPGC